MSTDNRGLTRRPHWGIRARMATFATAVVALTLILSGFVLVALVHQSLIAGLDDTQMARAQNVAAQAAKGIHGRITSSPKQNSLVQVLDSTGKVIAATANIEGEDPVLGHAPAKRHPTTSILSDSPLDTGGEFRVLAQPVKLKDGPGWIYIANSLSQVDTATSSLTTLFAVGLPLVLFVVGFVVWRAVTQALRPVEQIRRRASAIGAEDLSQRLPVPSSRDEIARLTATMNQLLDRLETAASRQKQFIGDASHELRSPLTALRAQVEVAMAHPDESNSEHLLHVIRDQVARMTMLTEDLLFLAQSTETNPMTLAAPVDLDELVLAEVHRQREIGVLTVTLDAIAAARVPGSQRDLSRVLRNLTDNAREHAHTEIVLSLSTQNGVAEIIVVDDGEGVPAADRERLFDRFTRLDNARPRSSTGAGFGLGLAIARQIVGNHHGSLTAHDRPDGKRGAMFLIRIPLAEE